MSTLKSFIVHVILAINTFTKQTVTLLALIDNLFPHRYRKLSKNSTTLYTNYDTFSRISITNNNNLFLIFDQVTNIRTSLVVYCTIMQSYIIYKGF